MWTGILLGYYTRMVVREIVRWVLNLPKGVNESFYERCVEAYKRSKGVGLEKELEMKLYYSKEPMITS